jgi:hypothetical protein
MAMHKMQQRQLPLVLIGAGLPILPGLAGESKSYAERLFNFPDIGPLAEPDAAKALREPIEAAGESIAPAALSEIYRLTRGFPYFLQEWGYQAWNHAVTSPIGLDDVFETTEIVTKRLDENFFRVRFDRLTPREKKYLRAMASLGHGPYRSSDIADALDANIKTLGPLRASLIKKGMVWPSHRVALYRYLMSSCVAQYRSSVMATGRRDATQNRVIALFPRSEYRYLGDWTDGEQQYRELLPHG